MRIFGIIKLIVFDSCDVISIVGLGWTLLQKKCTNWGWCMKYWSSKVFLARNLARCLVSQHCERLERFLVSRLCETRNLASRKITVETMRDSTLQMTLFRPALPARAVFQSAIRKFALWGKSQVDFGDPISLRGN